MRIYLLWQEFISFGKHLFLCISSEVRYTYYIYPRIPGSHRKSSILYWRWQEMKKIVTDWVTPPPLWRVTPPLWRVAPPLLRVTPSLWRVTPPLWRVTLENSDICCDMLRFFWHIDDIWCISTSSVWGFTMVLYCWYLSVWGFTMVLYWWCCVVWGFTRVLYWCCQTLSLMMRWCVNEFKLNTVKHAKHFIRHY